MMKKVFTHFTFFAFLLVGCSVENDISVQNNLEDNQLTKQRSKTPFNDIGYLSIAYYHNVREELKEEVRNRKYNYIITDIFPTRCNNAEVWKILYDIDGRPGPVQSTKDADDPDKELTPIIAKVYLGITEECPIQ